MKYNDETMKIDFELPEQIKIDIENLIKARSKKNNAIEIADYEMELISDLNTSPLSLDEVKFIRAKYYID